MLLEHLPYLASKHIVLASASPRRLQLLQMVGLAPRVLTSTFAEDLSKSDCSKAADYAVATSQHKALEVAERMQSAQDPFDLIIGADTVVDLAGTVLEKPNDAQHAAQMLQKLSDCEHQVHTGTTLVLPTKTGLDEGMAPKFQVITFATTTTVRFAELSPAEIEAYISTGETFGKAGAYGIQGAASVFVKELQGDYFNVMGFPLHSFANHVSDLIRQKAL